MVKIALRIQTALFVIAGLLAGERTTFCSIAIDAVLSTAIEYTVRINTALKQLHTVGNQDKTRTMQIM
jgi:hypothetical protein